MLKKLLIATLVAASLGGVCTYAPAATNIYVQTAPPEPRSERVPAVRRGYVWAPGYWDWKGRRHVWVAGHWVRARQGYAYRPHAWVERDGRWYLERGRWVRGGNRDRDGDGVPNRRDARPDDPRRR